MRERAGYNNGLSLGSSAADCAISSAGGDLHCYGTAHSLGLNLTQTLWSFQSFSQLKEANFQVAAAEASFQGAQQSLLLRVAQAYFNVLSAADQLETNVAEREAFGELLRQAKDGSKPESARAAMSIRRKPSTMPQNKASSMRAMRSMMPIWLSPSLSANRYPALRRCGRIFRWFPRSLHQPMTG